MASGKIESLLKAANYSLNNDTSVIAVKLTDFAGGLVIPARKAASANVGYYSRLQDAVWKHFSSNSIRTDEGKTD